MTELRVRVAIMPAGGLVERVTFPENESRLVTVMVEFRVESNGITNLVGSALMPKSGDTTKVATVRIAVTEPLVPATLTV